MRDHATIVRDVGALPLSRKLEAANLRVSPSAPQKWADRDSIPGEYWAAFERLGIATVAELAAAADAKRARAQEAA